MLSIVTKMWPAGDKDQQPIDSFRFQLTQLTRALIKCRQAVVLRKVLRIVAVAIRTHVSEDARARLRCSDQVAYQRSASNLFLERNEQTSVHHVTAITF